MGAGQDGQRVGKKYTPQEWSNMTHDQQFQAMMQGGGPDESVAPTSTETHPRQPDEIFTPEGIANLKKNGVYQDNPFQPGSEEYKGFQAEQIKDFKNYAGAPVRSEWQSMLNPDTGLLGHQNQDGTWSNPYTSNFSNVSDQIKNQFGSGTQVNQNPLHQLENFATSTDQSPWLKQALAANDSNVTSGVNAATDQSAADQAGAESDLAMRGGLSSGARERLAESGAKNSNAAVQNVRNTGATNAANLGMQETQNKMTALSALPGQEVAAVQPEIAKQEYLGNVTQQQQSTGLQNDQYNIQNALNEILQKRGNDVNTYNQQMSAWGAGKSADAQAGAGKK